MTSPMIFTRDGYVIFSATKPAMKMKFWHIHSMERLKRELIRWLDGDIVEGEKLEGSSKDEQQPHLRQEDLMFGWRKSKQTAT